MEISTDLTAKKLIALESLSTPEGRDAFSKQVCLETILIPGKNPHLSRTLVPIIEADLAKKLNGENLGEKIGGLMKSYLKGLPANNASLLDFYHGHVQIYNLFAKNELALDQAQDAAIYLTDKFIGSKFAKASEFAYYLNPNSKFHLEAEIEPINLFGQVYAKFKNFKLNSCGMAIDIPEKYKGLCEALILREYQDSLLSLESKEDRAKPIMTREEAMIDAFIEKVNGQKV